MKKFILLSLLLSTAPLFGKSSSLAGFVEIRPGHKLYVEHHSAAPGRPTVFLANGLTYSTRQYDVLVQALRKLDPGVGIVAYDMQGMGQTLLENLDIRKASIPLEAQVRDLHDLVRAMKISGPISVAGLSYGGALELLYSTLFPNDFDNYIAMAPLLERLPDQDRLMKYWVMRHKLWQPWDPRNDDELYDHYLRIFIYGTYPLAEPIIMENPFKLEAVFRMVQGVKNWNAFAHARDFPEGKIHIIGAIQDEHVKIARLDDFWQKMSKHSRASYLRLDSSKHKIPEQWPQAAAAWILQILSKNPDLQRGLIFEGDPYESVAKHGAIHIPLDKAGNCESLLRTVP